MQPILRIATNAIREASQELMARASQVPQISPSINLEVEYVQRTRSKAMRAITSVLQTSYPDAPVLDALDFTSTNEELAWVVEPIDGAKNFMRRIDDFCSLVGVYIQGKLTHGLVIDHFRDGHNVVTKEQGAFDMQGRIRVSELRALQQSLVATDDVKLSNHIDQLGTTTRISGSPILDLIYTCSGRIDCLIRKRISAFEFDFSRMFIRESGGFATTLIGGEWMSATDGLVAGNTYVHRKVVSTLTQNVS